MIEKNKNINNNEANTVNAKVIFSSGRVAELLRKLEKFLNISLSLRSSSGEVVCKTDYFNGPCNYIRGTEVGCVRCRKVYATIERKIIRRKIPYVCQCYCGFLIFAVPLEFRGEMVGILIGSQIIPVSSKTNIEDFQKSFNSNFSKLNLSSNEEFNKSFKNIKTLDDENQRLKFLSYIEEIGRNFVEMAAAEKTWVSFLKDIKKKEPEFGKF